MKALLFTKMFQMLTTYIIQVIIKMRVTIIYLNNTALNIYACVLKINNIFQNFKNYVHFFMYTTFGIFLHNN